MFMLVVGRIRETIRSHSSFGSLGRPFWRQHQRRRRRRRRSGGLKSAVMERVEAGSTINRWTPPS